ncbi:Fe-S oxidoreductase [Geoalkalibacter ferrihydriticus]|uniref:Radical SAM protein n=2 Tax=Geoalkalibacter ferrihydriticus TaxID=392333 RepID=A0A0C2HX28_9BACT|nr:radical SAM protein [Geoalkalibacter ferrihydriticus]KIH77337.1 radical SAM protein [Geoalkalibacter ferrihydriticus DSM 17813]SDM19291.1 Fe-S oxidoreductase [Geoalkalibacter ferrihydriticus]
MYYYFDYEEPVFRPPSEARSLILQATIGCSQNSCGFCGMYKMKRFRVRPVAETLAEIRSIPRHHREDIQRVFLADGDALVAPQADLVAILDELAATLPHLTRVGIYASPNSLTTKTQDDLEQLREKKVRILYFGLESGDDPTLQLARKGFSAQEMLALCRKAQAAGIKLSVTAILGLAGQERSAEHALATANWINALSPEYFSLLTMFRRHNDTYFSAIRPLSNGQIIQEALTLVRQLQPRRTILRSNHISNNLNLAGSYPKDRDKIIAQAEMALLQARRQPSWFEEIPDYGEAYY